MCYHEDLMSSILIVLSALWAFIYWIFGGVLFSLIALLRVGRIRRTWFGCLFSFSALALGILAAWSGLKFSEPRLAACNIDVAALDRMHLWIERFTCGIVEIIIAFVLGFLLLLLLGAGLMAASSSNNEAKIEKKKQHHP